MKDTKDHTIHHVLNFTVIGVLAAVTTFVTTDMDVLVK